MLLLSLIGMFAGSLFLSTLYMKIMWFLLALGAAHVNLARPGGVDRDRWR